MIKDEEKSCAISMDDGIVLVSDGFSEMEVYKEDLKKVRMKSKADIERQITRINRSFREHRLYNRAQLLALHYNLNMSETEENKTIHKEYLSCLYPTGNIKPELTNKAERLLKQMNDYPYPQSVYAVMLKPKEPDTYVYPNIDSGDWVHCTFCDNSMLLPGGADKCPKCGSVGRLEWVDESRPEMQESELKKTSFEDRKLQVKNVFSEDTIRNDFPYLWERIQKGEIILV